MPGPWNPNSPATKGAEWAAIAAGGVVLDSGAAGVIARVPSSGAETILTVGIYVPSVISPGTYVLDIFLAGNEDVGIANNIFTARPNEDVALLNVRGVSVDTAGNRYQNIDESSVATADYITGTGASGASPVRYDGRMSVGVGNFAGKQIIGVTLKAFARGGYTTPPSSVVVDTPSGPRTITYPGGTVNVSDLGSGLILGGTLYTQATASGHNLGTLSQGGNTRFVTWATNPQTGVAWTAADVEKLDTTDAYRWTYAGGAETFGALGLQNYQSWLEITYLATEHRVATGSLVISAPGYQFFTVAVPAGGNWAKSAATTYDYLLRRASASGSITVRTLDSGLAIPIGHTSYPHVVLGPGGVISAQSYPGTGIGAPSTAVLGIIPQVTGPADSADSQPYAEQVSASVKSGQTAEQNFSNAVVALYGFIQARVKHGGAPTADLLVKVRQQTGSNLVPNGTFETNVTGWAAGEAGTTIAQSAAQAHSGSDSMLLTRTGALADANVSTPTGVSGIPVTAGLSYTASAWVRGGTQTSNTYVFVSWWTAGGAFISEVAAANAGTSTSAWTQISGTLVAPAGAAFAAIHLRSLGMATSGTQYYDDVTFVTNPTVGGTLNITKAMVDALTASPLGWKAVAAKLASSATLATATQYYLEFSSAVSGVGADSWSVLAFDTTNVGNDETFGAASSPVDQGKVNGTRSQRYTLAATISQVPAAPTGLAVTTLHQTLVNAAQCNGALWDYLHFTWTATALGAAFAYYEIQRSSDGGVTWATVRTIPLEATAAYDTYETRRGVLTSFRMRVVLLSGASSDWSATATGTAQPSGPGCVYGFVSDENPALNCAYVKLGPDETYAFPSAAEAKFDPIYGRDYQVASIPSENRGVTFTLSLLVTAITTPPVSGTATRPFQALRDISTASLSYVAVIDPEGNKTLANVRVPQGTRHEPAAMYIAQVDVTEITNVASIPTT